ncbi:YbaB/EbfC family DNA-binding protein [Pseudonocardiaceae bacterium YIM PH 21723]|nr:YbaB/EbfC family DNA-binding protein [Pseudonocardiaceae bacterium YIM PH 21723]
MLDRQTEVDRLVAEYRAGREQLAGVQRDLAAITEQVRSADGTVTTRVNGRGELRGLIISPDAYRLHRPQDLAELIIGTAAAATQRAQERTAEVLAPMLPEGADPHALLDGRADLAEREITPPQADDEDSFEDRNWVR